MIKSELRKLFLDRRRGLTSNDVALMSARITDRFFSSFEFAGVNALHCFISIAKFNEADTGIIFERAWNEFSRIRTFAPRLNRATDALDHISYSRAALLIESAWGIREPAGDEKADPNEIDLVVVPLLCFDRRGYRVGYGKGYYDRFLERCRPDCLKVGVSFFPPVDSIDDTHDGDVPLDACITPDALFEFPGSI